MPTDWRLAAQLAAPVGGAVAGWWLHRVFERRSRLVTYYGHVSRFTLKEPAGAVVHTHAVVIRNVGKKAATNVRVSHLLLPDFTVYPAVPHTVDELPGGGKDIVLQRLVPNEQVTINYLYFPPVTYNQVTTGVRSDEGFAKVVPVLLTRQYPRWLNAFAGALMLVGGVAVLYVFIAIGTEVWNRCLRG